MTTFKYGELKARVNALPALQKLVESVDMKARKSLGQHFLFDSNLTRKIAQSAGPLTGTTIEIGPGPGGLTRALLLEDAANVIAVEKDRRANSVLSSLCEAAGNRLSLIEGDAINSPIWEYGTSPRRVIANLPYNIATKLLLQWLKHGTAFESMTLMFQREVAERITARKGDRAYSRLSVITGWYADAEILFDVPATAFHPPPKIISSVVQIVPLSMPRYPCSLLALEAITRAAFGQRRKMLRSSLKKIHGDRLLANSRVNPQARPQDIDLESFCELARLYEAASKNQPSAQHAVS